MQISWVYKDRYLVNGSFSTGRMNERAGTAPDGRWSRDCLIKNRCTCTVATETTTAVISLYKDSLYGNLYVMTYSTYRNHVSEILHVMYTSRQYVIRYTIYSNMMTIIYILIQMLTIMGHNTTNMGIPYSNIYTPCDTYNPFLICVTWYVILSIGTPIFDVLWCILRAFVLKI